MASHSEPLLHQSTTAAHALPLMPELTKDMRDAGCRKLMWLFDERADGGFSDWAEEIFVAMWEAQTP